MQWKETVRPSVILLKVLGAPASKRGYIVGLAVLQVTKNWVEPGRGFCNAVVGLDLVSFPGSCAGEEKEGVRPCFCSSVSTHGQRSVCKVLKSTRLCMWHYTKLMHPTHGICLWTSHHINAWFCL